MGFNSGFKGLKFPVKGNIQVPQRSPYEKRHQFLELSYTCPLIIHFFLKVPDKWALLHVPQNGPYRGRCSVSRANGLSINLYPFESPINELCHENRENIRSPSTEPHVDGRPKYNGVRLRSSTGSLRYCYHYHSAMKPSARYLPPWLG